MTADEALVKIRRLYAMLRRMKPGSVDYERVVAAIRRLAEWVRK